MTKFIEKFKDIFKAKSVKELVTESRAERERELDIFVKAERDKINFLNKTRDGIRETIHEAIEDLILEDYDEDVLTDVVSHAERKVFWGLHIVKVETREIDGETEYRLVSSWMKNDNPDNS